MSPDRLPCSELSTARQEPLLATASRVERWLLVEHRGAWGPQAPPMARLPVELSRALGAAADASGARLLMVRRPLRSAGEGRWVFAARSRPGAERLLGRHVADDEELVDLVPPFGEQVPDGWAELEAPLWLVCTQGRHDLCCAKRGRPVADALLAGIPEDVWEVSHIGGDRFAANVLQLPDGHYFGRVSSEGAVGLVTRFREGRLNLDCWRGRSSLPLPTQAAQAFARAATGRDRVDDLALVAQHDDGPDQWRVQLAPGSGGDGYDVVVRYVRTGDPVQLTCDADKPAVAGHFRQVRLSSVPQ